MNLDEFVDKIESDPANEGLVKTVTAIATVLTGIALFAFVIFFVAAYWTGMLLGTIGG